MTKLGNACHGGGSHTDPQVQAGGNIWEGEGIRAEIKGNDKENVLKVALFFISAASPVMRGHRCVMCHLLLSV